MSTVIEREEITSTTNQESKEWKVIVFNDEDHSFQEVIDILKLATGCSDEEAYVETWEIDAYGQCAVHYASEDECEAAAKIIGRIGLKVEVSKD